MITLLRHSRTYKGLCKYRLTCDICGEQTEIKAVDIQDAMNQVSNQFNWWVSGRLVCANPPIISEVMAECPPCNEAKWEGEKVNAH